MAFCSGPSGSLLLFRRDIFFFQIELITRQHDIPLSEHTNTMKLLKFQALDFVNKLNELFWHQNLHTPVSRFPFQICTDH
ncbi:hypothetical protein BpHYR1_020865 [Brachionus plicatilis]|uniref:Uncharacterized protein n=1 Tax=Brachionus plicatilis TaxID=10195 RepID=A0A3M7RWS1_BRAPC|nr:hypothetical protein BpHYR1_020865 [Brachionus plicatilis]